MIVAATKATINPGLISARIIYLGMDPGTMSHGRVAPSFGAQLVAVHTPSTHTPHNCGCMQKKIRRSDRNVLTPAAFGNAAVGCDTCFC